MQPHLIIIPFLGLLLSGCAAMLKPVPSRYTMPSFPAAPAYDGPVARISDHGEGVDEKLGVLFYLEAVDGRPLQSGIYETRRATEGGGFYVAMRYALHTIPARPSRFKIVARHVTGAPLHEIGLRLGGNFVQVTGEVHFTPKADTEYVVYGRIQPTGSYVCIADSVTGDCVSERVIGK